VVVVVPCTVKSPNIVTFVESKLIAISKEDENDSCESNLVSTDELNVLKSSLDDDNKPLPSVI
jgi:hypothetical protein